jgi:hypothetical protein
LQLPSDKNFEDMEAGLDIKCMISPSFLNPHFYEIVRSRNTNVWNVFSNAEIKKYNLGAIEKMATHLEKFEITPVEKNDIHD